MPTKRGEFDATGFYQALDVTRRSKDLSWREVAGATGVSPSTLTRMAQGKRPDVDSLAALAAWSGLSADGFIRSVGEVAEAEPLAMISTYLRSDRNLSPEAATALDQIIRAAYDQLRDQLE